MIDELFLNCLTWLIELNLITFPYDLFLSVLVESMPAWRDWTGHALYLTSATPFTCYGFTTELWGVWQGHQSKGRERSWWEATFENIILSHPWTATLKLLNESAHTFNVVIVQLGKCGVYVDWNSHVERSWDSRNREGC